MYTISVYIFNTRRFTRPRPCQGDVYMTHVSSSSYDTLMCHMSPCQGDIYNCIVYVYMYVCVCVCVCVCLYVYIY